MRPGRNGYAGPMLADAVIRNSTLLTIALVLAIACAVVFLWHRR